MTDFLVDHGHTMYPARSLYTVASSAPESLSSPSSNLSIWHGPDSRREDAIAVYESCVLAIVTIHGGLVMMPQREVESKRNVAESMASWEDDEADRRRSTEVALIRDTRSPSTMLIL